MRWLDENGIGLRSAAANSDQAIVVGVTGDPIPDDAIFLHDRKRAVFETDASRIDFVLAFEFLNRRPGRAGLR